MQWIYNRVLTGVQGFTIDSIFDTSTTVYNNREIVFVPILAITTFLFARFVDVEVCAEAEDGICDSSIMWIKKLCLLRTACFTFSAACQSQHDSDIPKSGMDRIAFD